MNYNTLRNKPTINHKELIGNNKASDIGGMTEEDMEQLLETDLTPYYTKDQIDDLFSRSFVYREKSGSIVTFDCPSTSLTIPEVTTEIVAVQDLHGYDSPWTGGAGKNKIDMADITVTSQYFSSYYSLKAGTYTVSVNIKNNTTIIGNLYLLDSSNTNLVNLQINANEDDRRNATFTLSNDDTVRFKINGTASGYNYNISKVQIESGSTATSYAPYSNICHISGWSAVNVYDGPTTDPQDATVYTTALKDANDQSLTCYGGQLVNENGVQTLTLTHGYIASYNGETLPSTWISDRDVYAEGTTPTTGAEVVYELATPQTIPQDNLAISSSAGINNIWCDSGDITVKALDRIIQE